MSRSTLDPARFLRFSCTGLSPCIAGFPNTVPLSSVMLVAVHNPDGLALIGLASFHFARRYFGNRVFFLFLSLLRCFSSRRSLYCTMDLCNSDWAFPSRVPPFGHLRLTGYVRLTAAFRSLSRPSSAPGAKASSLRSSSLDPTSPLHSLQRTGEEFRQCFRISSILPSHCLVQLTRCTF